MKQIAFTILLAALVLCACSTSKSKGSITAEMAYEGVNNYCHETYYGNVADTDSVTMYLTMGEETEKEYQVVFRSYTGALVNFYVDKKNGTTRMEEYVPALDTKNDAGTIDLHDYLGKENGD